MDARLNTALLFSLLVAASSVQAATRCEAGNLSLPEEIACAKAAQSTEALRHYVQRTRALHGLYLWDYVKRDAARTAAAEQSMAMTDAPETVRQAARR